MRLTEKEFDTIIEALEQLPNKSLDGKLTSKLMARMIFRNDEEAMRKAEEELAIQELKEEADRKALKKRIGILTGKLYMIKDEIVEEQS